MPRKADTPFTHFARSPGKSVATRRRYTPTTGSVRDEVEISPTLAPSLELTLTLRQFGRRNGVIRAAALSLSPDELRLLVQEAQYYLEHLAEVEPGSPAWWRAMAASRG